jgi:hypothetical protein
MIDPSVTDEADPLSIDSELDPYDPANGFDESGSHYDDAWLASYREAQRARVQRIDDHARELLADQRAARKRFKADADQAAARRAVLSPVITTWRTDADPRCTDLGLDANDRRYGSVISPKPQMSNYVLGGFGRLTTADSWLSTWSGLSSNAAVGRCLAGVGIPTQIIEYTGDQSVFPSDIATALAASAAEEKDHRRIPATHFAKRLTPEQQDPLDTTVEALIAFNQR